MKKNVASQVVGAQMVSASDGSAFTGSVTVYVTGNAGTQAIGSVGSGACTHEGNGFHTYAPAQAETNYDHVAFTFVGTGAVPATVQVFTSFPQTVDNATNISAIKTKTDSLTFTVANVLDANTLRVGGTTQTARDIGASVLLSNGTSTGQISLSSGLVTLAGVTHTGAVIPTVTTLTGHTAQTGDAYARLGAPAGASVSADVAAVKADTGNLVTRITSSLFSGITSLAQWLGLLAGKQTGNSTARTELRATGAGSGTFDETTDSQEALRDRGDAAWTTATGFSTLDAAGVRSAVGLGSANLDSQLDALPTAAENATAVWAAGTRTLTALDEDSTTLDLDATIRGALGMSAADLDSQLLGIGNNASTAAGAADALYMMTEDVSGRRWTAKALEQAPTGSGASAADIAAAVWDEAIADHADAGSTGEALAAAGAAGDPWITALPGSYSSGQAGYIVGTNLNAAVSSRASQASVDDLPTNAELATALDPLPTAAENATAVWGAGTRTLTAIDEDGTTLDIDATVRAALGMASANMDTQLGDVPTAAENAQAVADLVEDRTVIRGTCASGATTTTMTPSSLSPNGTDADQFKGRILIFDNSTSTAALRGQATDITANTAASLPLLTFTALTTAPASGDTFSIV